MRNKKDIVALIDGTLLKDLIVDNLQDRPIALVKEGNNYYLESTNEESEKIEVDVINSLLLECK